MNPKVFKSAIAVCIALLAISSTSFAQDVIVDPVSPATDSVAAPVTVSSDVVAPVVLQEPLVKVRPLAMSVKVNNIRLKAELHKMKVEMKSLSVKANVQMKNLSADLKEVAPQINVGYKDGDNINYTDNVQDGNELVKNYSKTYQVDDNDKLVIDNRYGQVVVNTWARNEIKVDVQIKASAGSDDEAHKIFDNVSISDSKDGNTVAFRTNINEIKSSWLSIFKGNGNNGNHHIEINYTVYMPAKNELVIDNRYGGIVIPDMDGKVTINSAYGSLAAGTLTNESTIRVKYGNANITSVGTSAIDMGYGNLSLGTATKLAANVSYSGIRIGRIRETCSINIRYGDGVDIKDIDRNMRDLAINASYTNVNIGLSGDENADFAVTVHYGDFDFDDKNVTVTAKNPDDKAKGPHFTHSFKGYLGKGSGSGKNIAVNASYGNVKFD